MSAPLHDVLSAAIADVFEPLDLVVAHADEVEEHSTLRAPVAIVGFTGQIVGAIALVVPWELLQATHPDRTATIVDLADWAGELANMLTGRIKTRLGDIGSTMRIAIPQVVLAPDVRANKAGAWVARMTCHGPGCPATTLAVLFDATPMDGVDSAICPTAAPAGYFIDLT